MTEYLYPLLPSVVSIILVVTGNYRGGYLERLTDTLRQSERLGEGRNKEEIIKLIQSVASDWATRIGYFNATIALVVSYFVLFSNVDAPSLEIVTFLVLLVVLVLSWFLILRHDPGDLVAKTQTDLSKTNIPMKPATLLSVVLVLLNVGLIILILYSYPSSGQTPTD